MLPPPLHQKSNLPVGHASNSSSHILLDSPSSCSCMAVLCWIRFSLSIRLRNMALAIQRYGHTTRKHRCIPVFGYAFHSHLGLGQIMGITVKRWPPAKRPGATGKEMDKHGARGRNQTTRCRSSSQQHNLSGQGQGPGTRLSLGPWKREEIGDNPNILLLL